MRKQDRILKNTNALEIVKLPKEESAPYYEVMVDISSLDNLGDGEPFDGLTLELQNPLGGGRYILSLDYGEGGDEPLMTPTEAEEDYRNQIGITTYSYERDWDEDTEEWVGAENTNIWTGTINFPTGNQREGGEFYARVFGFKDSESQSEAEDIIMKHITDTIELNVRQRDEEDGMFYPIDYYAETFGAENNPHGDLCWFCMNRMIKNKWTKKNLKDEGYGITGDVIGTIRPNWYLGAKREFKKPICAKHYEYYEGGEVKERGLLSKKEAETFEAESDEIEIKYYMVSHNEAKNQHKYYIAFEKGTDSYTAHGRLPGYGRETTIKVNKQPNSEKMMEMVFKKMKTYRVERKDQMPSEIRRKLEIELNSSSSPPKSEPKEEVKEEIVDERDYNPYERMLRRRMGMGAEEAFISTDMSPSYIDIVLTDEFANSWEGRLRATLNQDHSGAKKGLISYDPSTGKVIYYHKGQEYVGDVNYSEMNFNPYFETDQAHLLDEEYDDELMAAETFDVEIDYKIKEEIEGFWKLEDFVVDNYGEDYTWLPLSESNGYWDIFAVLPNVIYTDNEGKIHKGIAIIDYNDFYEDGKCEDCGNTWNIDANYDGDEAYCPECGGKLIDRDTNDVLLKAETFENLNETNMKDLFMRLANNEIANFGKVSFYEGDNVLKINNSQELRNGLNSGKINRNMIFNYLDNEMSLAQMGAGNPILEYIDEYEAETFGAWDKNCSVCNGTGWMPKKGDPNEDAEIAKIFGLSIDELTLEPCNAGGKSMGCWNAETFEATKRKGRKSEAVPFSKNGWWKEEDFNYAKPLAKRNQFEKEKRGFPLLSEDMVSLISKIVDGKVLKEPNGNHIPNLRWDEEPITMTWGELDEMCKDKTFVAIGDSNYVCDAIQKSFRYLPKDTVLTVYTGNKYPLKATFEFDGEEWLLILAPSTINYGAESFEQKIPPFTDNDMWTKWVNEEQNVYPLGGESGRVLLTPIKNGKPLKESGSIFDIPEEYFNFNYDSAKKIQVKWKEILKLAKKNDFVNWNESIYHLPTMKRAFKNLPKDTDIEIAIVNKYIPCRITFNYGGQDWYYSQSPHLEWWEQDEVKKLQRRMRDETDKEPEFDPDFDPVKADRNKDGKISDWEKAVGNAVAKGIREHKRGKEAETFEAVVVNRGKQPKGALGKAVLNQRMIEQSKVMAILEELENKVRLGLIDEKQLMGDLKRRFGAESTPVTETDKYDEIASRFTLMELEIALVQTLNKKDMESANEIMKVIQRKKFINEYQAENNEGR